MPSFRPSLVAAALLAAAPLAAQAPLLPILEDVKVLAADSLGGRFTGSAGARTAAAYLARRFREVGARPAGTDYLQPFAVSGNAPAVKALRLPFPLEGVNVAAFLPGRDRALRDEVVLVGAHYDHLGLGGFSSAMDTTYAVHNGADDNASGAAALIRIAEVLKRAGTRRSVLLVAFSGEELGLLGSQAYVRQPLRPLAQTVAMVNLDMVGRLRNERLIVYGAATAKEFPALLDSLNATAKFDLRASGDGYGPSDHSSFYAQKLPVLHFFTDLHEDYHRATDDWERINATGLQRVADFAAATAKAIADRPTRLTLVDLPPSAGRMTVTAPANPHDAPGTTMASPSGGAGTASRSSGYGAYFGSIPDMAGGADKGVPFSGVRAGSPAEQAGLKAGDILIRIAEHEIPDLQAMTNVLRTYRPGDKVRVVVLREGREVGVDLTFGQRN